LFGKNGVAGLVNVDLTPEIAVRFAAALGTALKRGARVVGSREPGPAPRMIKRAMIAGLNAAGINVADLHALPGAVGRHLLKAQGYDAGFHVGISSVDPEGGQIRLFGRPGIAVWPAVQMASEK